MLKFNYFSHFKVRSHPLADDIKVSSFELQLLKLTSSSSSFAILNIYRPPSSSVAIFLDEFADTISTICASLNDKLLIGGDLKCPGVDSSSIDSNLETVLNSFGLDQLVIDSTRDNNLLDVLATDDSSAVSEVCTDDSGCLSDHRLVCAKLAFRKSPQKQLSQPIATSRK